MVPPLGRGSSMETAVLALVQVRVERGFARAAFGLLLLGTLLAVAAVRQRRYAGDKPIGQQHKENVQLDVNKARHGGGRSPGGAG